MFSEVRFVNLLRGWRTSLMEAITNGDDKVVDLLLKSGANVNDAEMWQIQICNPLNPSHAIYLPV